jgi:UDP-N-acetylmuramyl pentapeptide phosphotransferase/UDP-N-acetylglucosamine-1-phosphate transferase
MTGTAAEPGNEAREMGWVLLLAPLAVFIATWWLTGRVRAWLARRAILDRPVARSAHRAPVPRGGGLALVPVIIAAWLGLALLGRTTPANAGIALLAGGLSIVSWLDDLRSLPAWLRLAAHLMAAAIGLAFLPGAGAVFQGLLPPLLDRMATALLWVWFVNLFNFMDGIDGISGVETASVGIGVALVVLGGSDDPDGSAVLALTLAAGMLAFLCWNWHPAQLFLGDVGSVPLGYLLGWLLLGLAGKGLWAPALILPLYYLADATITLARRALRRERVWEAHRQHFYQRALGADGNHAAVARLVLAADALLVVLALLALARPRLALGLAGLVVATLLVTMARRARKRRADGRSTR